MGSSSNSNGNSNVLQDYIDHLKEELKIAENKLNSASEKVSQHQFLYESAVGWRDSVKAYWERISATNELTKELFSPTDKSGNWKVGEKGLGGTGLLKNLHDTNESVVKSTNNTVEAVELLAAYVKKTSEDTEKANASIKKLMDKTGELTPPIDPKNPIMAGLTDLKDKMQEGQKKILEAITPVLKLLKSSHHVNELLNQDEHGTGWNINQMINLLMNGKLVLPDDQKLSQKGLMAYSRIPNFPLEYCDGDYYDRTRWQIVSNNSNELPKAERAVVEAKKDLDEVKKAKETALSQRNGLKAAMDAAQAAKVC